MYGYLERIRRSIAAERDGDPQVDIAVAKLRFEFVFDALPTRTSDQDRLAREILDVVRASAAQRIVTGRWEECTDGTLARCGGRWKAGSPDANDGPITLMMSSAPFPDDVVDAIVERIAEKRTRVPGYGMLEGRPLWLVLCLWDPFAPDNWGFGPTKRRIAEIDAAPFDRLVIGCIDGGFVLEHDPAAEVRHIRLFGEEQIPRSGDIVIA